MPYHYPDRNTFYRAQRAEQARINRVNAGIQRYKDSLNSSNNDFLHAKPSDFNKYAKMAKVGIHAVGFHYSVIGLIFLLLLVCSVFAFANDVNEVFTFESLLDAIRDFPTIELPQFRVSDDLKNLSDSIFDYSIDAVYKLTVNISNVPGLEFLINPLLDIIQALYNSESFVGRIVLTVTTPLDFVVYIITSMMQLLTLIFYIIGRLFVLPTLPV